MKIKLTQEQLDAVVETLEFAQARYEQEAAATIYTYNTGLQRTLISLCESHPAQVRQTEDNGIGALTFELPKKWVKVSPPRALSEAQKKVLEDMNRKNRERRK